MSTLIATLLLAAAPIDVDLGPNTWHPHFPRSVEMRLGFGGDAPSIRVSHLTVTFDREGFEKAKPGYSWHLANGRLETEKAITIGGVKLKPGTYSIKARKRDDGKWELVADTAGRFKARLTDEARALKTEFSESKAPREHMTIDIHPHGAKDSTKLWLEVHMDKYIARSLVELEK